jgi:hypothetical protein
MAKASPGIDPDKLALYDRLLATIPGVERKGATMPYTSHAGNMFSFLTNDGRLALRLGDGARQQFLTKYRTTLCEQHGAVMKEYVVVPDALLRRTAELAAHLAASYRYVGTLAPKATTRVAKKPAAKATTRAAKKPAAAKATRPAKRATGKPR